MKGRTFSNKELLVNLGYKANVHYNQRPVEEPYNQRQVQLKYDWASVPYLSGDHCVQCLYTKLMVGRIMSPKMSTSSPQNL